MSKNHSCYNCSNYNKYNCLCELFCAIRDEKDSEQGCELWERKIKQSVSKISKQEIKEDLI